MIPMIGNDSTLRDETLVTLLLCSNMGKSDDSASPLSPTEFQVLIDLLEEWGSNLVDLTGPDCDELVRKIDYKSLSADRIFRLLDRGGTIAMALESLTNKGLWIRSKLDEGYPERLNSRLKHLAPPILFGAGDPALLSNGGLVIVGSRDVDSAGGEFARKAAALCARDGVTVISGGARGVDRIAMQSAFEEGGVVVGLLAASLERTAVNRENRDAILSGNLVLVSPYHPTAGFSVGNAMGRNKYMYALGDWALVVSSAHEKGGTWSGAIENLKSSHGIPIFVRLDADVPSGNEALVARGGCPITTNDLDTCSSIGGWLASNAGPQSSDCPEPEPGDCDGQMTMFEP